MAEEPIETLEETLTDVNTGDQTSWQKTLTNLQNQLAELVANSQQNQTPAQLEKMQNQLTELTARLESLQTQNSNQQLVSLETQVNQLAENLATLLNNPPSRSADDQPTPNPEPTHKRTWV